MGTDGRTQTKMLDVQQRIKIQQGQQSYKSYHASSPLPAPLSGQLPSVNGSTSPTRGDTGQSERKSITWVSNSADGQDTESRRKILVYEKGLRNVQHMAQRQKDHLAQRRLTKTEASMITLATDKQLDRPSSHHSSTGSFSKFMPVTHLPPVQPDATQRLSVFNSRNSIDFDSKPSRYYQYGFPRHVLVPSQYRREQFGRVSKLPELEYPSWMSPQLQIRLEEFYDKYPAPKSELIPQRKDRFLGKRDSSILQGKAFKDESEYDEEEEKTPWVIEGIGGGGSDGGLKMPKPSTKKEGKLDKLLSVRFASID